MKPESAMLLMFLAVCCGGTMALFSKNLNAFGLNAYQISFFRSFLTAVFLIIIMVVMKVPVKIDRKTLLALILFAVSKMLSDVLIFASYEYITVALATVLQMTQVFFIFLISLLVFREKITVNKALSVGLGIFGCLLISGILTEAERVSLIGCLLALGSGACYAVFTLGCKYAADKNIDPMVSVFYIMLFAGILCIPFSGPFDVVADALITPESLAYILGLVFVCTLFPFVAMFTSAKWMPVTYVSVIGLCELVVAALVGLLAFGEVLKPLDILGMALLMTAVIVIDVAITNRIVMKLRETGRTFTAFIILSKLRRH